ncbi:MAG: adenylosuccinate lyase [bacterium]|nr:adenylosuccinate lyase [bacterium]
MLTRYTKPVMGEIWTSANKFAKWLEVEIAVLEAREELGFIPSGVSSTIRQHAKFTVEAIEAIDKVIDQDMVAFLRVVTESLPLEVRRYLHEGMTSYDDEDTALAIQTKESDELIRLELRNLITTTRTVAKTHRETLEIGRTHGIHAEPITFGLKVLNWVDELERHLGVLETNEPFIVAGKLSGATGTYGNIDPGIEALACRKLGIPVAKISTQIVSRDRHYLWLAILSSTSDSLAKFATEIRNLQRTEIGEVQEPFKEGGGSSAMPHKRNPNKAERIVSLARLIRVYPLVAAENNANCWHERSLDNSANERIILPDTAILVHYLLCAFNEELKGLKIFTEKMLENLHLTKGIIFSEDVMLALSGKGMSRDEARSLVQGLALHAWDHKKEFAEVLMDNIKVSSLLTEAEISACLTPRRHLLNIDQVFARFGIEKE